ncbi:putative C-type lectin domain family 20 member A isoform X9 [Xyrauchen texanus]|uniref:putative C-type lectin domain family 20 member A isoform X9 n=1 Tax=Xyrauchen texanus TaxID=154827 RepID=UPI002242253D|nr:putative C-type lectin domain family 20 member A isoform X9 [Xyrauchen texanus]
MRSDLLVVLLSVLSPFVSSRVFYYVSVPMNWTDAQTYCRHHYTDLATIDDEIDSMLTQTQTIDYTWIGLYRMNDTAPWMWSDQSTFNFNSWYGQPNQVSDISICTTTFPDGLWDDWQCDEVFPSICYNDSVLVTTQVTGTTTPSTVTGSTMPSTVAGTTSSSTVAGTTSSSTVAGTTSSSTVAGTTSFSTVAGTTSSSTEKKKTQRVRVQVKSRQNLNDPKVQKEILQKIEQILKQKGLPYDAKLSWKNQTDGNVFQKFQKHEDIKQTCN